ncbi:hypothetical protein C8P70_10968 [Myroides indicus]|uniref:Outer membrane protein assembly factor BamA n=1 Tax=Myroides indicus TaxID=1323422 RepID=A0A4R7EZ62_9FLAO|nr:hypothetical protein C8P70_10968 [Myroides indicus]
MKNILALICFLCITCNFFAQEIVLTLEIKSDNAKENEILAGLDYQKDHENINSITETIHKIDQELYHGGYLNLNRTEQKNKTHYTYIYNLNTPIAAAVFKTSALNQNIKKILQITNNELILPFAQTQSTLHHFTQLLEREGLGTSTILMQNHTIVNDTLICSLVIHTEKKRTLDKIEIVSQNKIPVSIIKKITQKNIGKDYNENLISKISSEVLQLDFIKEAKPAETLFTEDTTALFLFLNKKNTNQFDGYVGFNNDEDGKVILNGYLDLQLNNILNRGESLNLYWKNDGNKQTDFHFNAEIPYIFNTPLAVRGALDIQKQDSTYQNTKLELQLGYYFSYNNKVFIGYQTNTSATNSTSLDMQGYDSKFYTLAYHYKKNRPYVLLFPVNLAAYIKVGTGKRTSEDLNDNQSFAEVDLKKNIQINSKNYLYLRWQNYALFSDSFFINELQRFGGNNSLRGFQENSLYASKFSLINTEYRFLLSQNLYIHSIIDYAYQENEKHNQKNHLYSLGFGIGMLTSSGKFNLSFANGKQPNDNFKFDNTTIHISFSTIF